MGVYDKICIFHDVCDGFAGCSDPLRTVLCPHESAELVLAAPAGDHLHRGDHFDCGPPIQLNGQSGGHESGTRVPAGHRREQKDLRRRRPADKLTV